MVTMSLATESVAFAPAFKALTLIPFSILTLVMSAASPTVVRLFCFPSKLGPLMVMSLSECTKDMLVPAFRALTLPLLSASL